MAIGETHTRNSNDVLPAINLKIITKIMKFPPSSSKLTQQKHQSPFLSKLSRVVVLCVRDCHPSPLVARLPIHNHDAHVEVCYQHCWHELKNYLQNHFIHLQTRERDEECQIDFRVSIKSSWRVPESFKIPCGDEISSRDARQ
jgi:hypothetical protein